MIKDGTTKADAQARLAESFWILSSIDITSYDPIDAAKTGDLNTSAILQANALIANTLKQVTAISESSNLNSSPVSIASKVASKLSELITDGNSLLADMQSSVVMESLIEDTIRDIDRSVSISDEKLNSYSTILQTSNLLLSENTLQSLPPGEMLKKLSQNQIAIEEEVLGGYAQLSEGLIDLDTLKTSTDLSTLSNVAELITAVNNFTPEGESFQKLLVNMILLLEKSCNNSTYTMPTEIRYLLQ